MTDFWTTIRAFAERATQTAGAQLLQDFGQVPAIAKADGSLVTHADRWADAFLCQAIREAFPNHGMLTEETEHIFPEEEWCWIVDPLDGTTNFARGLPIWGISLGLLYRGTPVFGYVALPPLRQAFYGYWAGDSQLDCPTGAWLIDAAKSPAKPTSIHVSPADPDPNQFFNLCARSTHVLQQQPFPCKIRMLGIATYNLLTIAAGIALAGVEATPKIWDIAAVWVITQAAGATWTPLEPEPLFPLQPGKDYSQRAYPTLVTSRPDLVPLFLPLVQSVGSKRML